MENIEKIDFKGKVVSFGSSDDNLALKKIKFETQFGDLFVVGEISKGTTTNDWAAGKKTAIRWSSVMDYIIFDSEQDFEESMANS